MKSRKAGLKGRRNNKDGEVKRYTDEMIEYARRWSEARDRYAQDPVKYPMPEPKDIPLPKVIASVKPWTDEEIEADTQNSSTRQHPCIS